MSQEYTPVSWQDETTSQQGTLINAERLNQMQTAHHYADGFEEVDEIPTEDPGTAYHKIVYCTEDAAFYRWDGTQWAKDVDDVTRAELDAEIERAEHAEGLIQGYLDAHEANHNNPHQVTKAQVGLGNCDNTADADKPISTAAQAALDTKADKATTLAGYGITDAYTKAQADTLLADKADKADVYDKTATDTLLAGKVDKLVLSPAGTYKSVTVNAQGQVTAGTNPDTLAGFGITDAYTKTEADTLLASKADKATTLAGYGITDAVTLNTAQSITANKNYLSNVLRVKDFNQPAYDTPTSNRQSIMLQAVGNDDVWGYRAEFWKNASGSALLQNRLRTPGGECEIRQTVESDGTAHARVIGQRAYNAANTSDIATIGTLDAYAPMVRTTGNQEIGGNKTFTSSPVALVPYYASFIHKCSNYTHNTQTATTIRMIQVNDDQDNYIGRLNLQVTSTGNLQLKLEGYVIDGQGNRTVKTVTIAELTQ